MRLKVIYRPWLVLKCCKKCFHPRLNLPASLVLSLSVMPPSFFLRLTNLHSYCSSVFPASPTP